MKKRSKAPVIKGKCIVIGKGGFVMYRDGRSFIKRNKRRWYTPLECERAHNTHRRLVLGIKRSRIRERVLEAAWRKENDAGM